VLRVVVGNDLSKLRLGIIYRNLLNLDGSGKNFPNYSTQYYNLKYPISILQDYSLVVVERIATCDFCLRQLPSLAPLPSHIQ
jgi:hypothetical protein